jgi:RND family efflux transporter MFP subunit
MKLLPESIRPALLLLTLAVLPVGCGQAPPAEENLPPAPVLAVNPRTLVFGQWVELDGTTQPLPQHSARVSAAVQGVVRTVLTGEDGKPVHEGQLVHVGDVIAELDRRIVEADRAKVEAGLKDLEQQKVQADIAVKLAQMQVRQLEGLMNRSTSAGGRAAGGLEVVSAVELDRARLGVESAQSQAQAAVAKHGAAVKELKAYDLQLGLYTLRAPITGRLGLLQVAPGQSIAPGTPVADVIDLDQIEALCYVPPHTRTGLALDQPARFVRTRENGQVELGPSSGKVVFLAPQAQTDTGNFAVKVRFPNKDGRLLANTVIKVQVETQPEKERLTIPEAALLQDQDPPAVIVIDKLETKKVVDNGEEKEQKIGVARRLLATVGARDREWHVVEILSLKDPDKKQNVPLDDVLVVTKGANGLRDGDPVRIAEEDDDEK